MTAGKFLSRGFAFLRSRRPPTGQITADRLQEMFDYSIRFNLCSASNAGLGGMTKLGTIISFEPVTRDIDMRQAAASHRRNEIITNPPHLCWGWNPTFAYLGLVDRQVEYRFTTGGKIRWREVPVTHDPVQIAAIDRMFDLWYRHLGLPDALRKPTRAERSQQMLAVVAGADKLALIRQYLSRKETEFLFEILGAENNNVLLWVDWGASDDDIVGSVETILQTGALSASFAETGDSPDLLVRWRGATIPVSYPASHADRETTLLALNCLLQPDYELRLCIQSRGNDTLAFLPLPAETWRELEREYPEAVASLFTRLAPDTVLFGA